MHKSDSTAEAFGSSCSGFRVHYIYSECLLNQVKTFCGRGVYIYTSSGHVFSQSHAPSFCLFMSLCFHPEKKKKKKFSQKRRKELHIRRGKSKARELTDSLSPFFTRGPCPSRFGGQFCIISKGLFSSAQLRVGCALLIHWDAVEQTPRRHLLSALHIQLEAEQTGAKTCRQWYHYSETSEKRQWVSGGILTRHILVAQFLFAHEMTFYITTESAHGSSHPYSVHNAMVFTHSHDAKLMFLVVFFLFACTSIPLLEESPWFHHFFGMKLFSNNLFPRHQSFNLFVYIIIIILLFWGSMKTCK